MRILKSEPAFLKRKRPQLAAGGLLFPSGSRELARKGWKGKLKSSEHCIHLNPGLASIIICLCLPALGKQRQRQVDLYAFEASLSTEFLDSQGYAPIEEGHWELWVNGQEQHRNGLGRLYCGTGTSDP
ncbi:hypothetical protein U0070_020863 [Myodes glareolus]|uniref:Uncharacterized protein n=1 Tax=Myodes glareolus TaxID=447135 RepID=A0AAW0IQ07_MYOGA